MWLFGEEVFRSFEASAVDRACQSLRDAGIRYRRRSINLLESPFSSNRGRMGSFGINEKYRYVYAVKVSNADAEQAKHILHSVKR